MIRFPQSSHCRPIIRLASSFYSPARPYYPPAPRHCPSAWAAYKAVYQPWTASCRRYSASKYRSFNPRTGTYRGIDGLNHFCNAN
ncbi:BA14K family protein [uncultured Bartonella sp.]|uniref:BA14K family protein n=1 Tax=uncultured Bartonella sp. TaxID=104108 RepID=UPI00344B35A9